MQRLPPKRSKSRIASKSNSRTTPSNFVSAKDSRPTTMRGQSTNWNHQAPSTSSMSVPSSAPVAVVKPISPETLALEMRKRLADQMLSVPQEFVPSIVRIIQIGRYESTGQKINPTKSGDVEFDFGNLSDELAADISSYVALIRNDPSEARDLGKELEVKAKFFGFQSFVNNKAPPAKKRKIAPRDTLIRNAIANSKTRSKSAPKITRQKSAVRATRSMPSTSSNMPQNGKYPQRTLSESSSSSSDSADSSDSDTENEPPEHKKRPMSIQDKLSMDKLETDVATASITNPRARKLPTGLRARQTIPTTKSSQPMLSAVSNGPSSTMAFDRKLTSAAPKPFGNSAPHSAHGLQFAHPNQKENALSVSQRYDEMMRSRDERRKEAEGLQSEARKRHAPEEYKQRQMLIPGNLLKDKLETDNATASITSPRAQELPTGTDAHQTILTTKPSRSMLSAVSTGPVASKPSSTMAFDRKSTSAAPRPFGNSTHHSAHGLQSAHPNQKENALSISQIVDEQMRIRDERRKEAERLQSEAYKRRAPAMASITSPKAQELPTRPPAQGFPARSFAGETVLTTKSSRPTLPLDSAPVASKFGREPTLVPTSSGTAAHHSARGLQYANPNLKENAAPSQMADNIKQIEEEKHKEALRRQAEARQRRALERPPMLQQHEIMRNYERTGFY